MLYYHSTRGDPARLTAGQAILKGIAYDGGLYAPESIPQPDRSLRELISLSYQDLAVEILKLYLTDYTIEEIRECVWQAYDEKFDAPEIAPLTEKAGHYFLELFHGKTLAFKDMALSLLPRLMKKAAAKQNVTEPIVILTATSGDTGKAAMEGFAGVAGTQIIVFYPAEGVSVPQKRQMQTQEGKNTLAVGILGNFDDAQTGVKKIFADPPPGVFLSSANSINIGRLIPQIVYYFYAYGRMVSRQAIAPGDALNFTVPTGNFGNILAGWYAKQMGLPVRKLICASNDNKVLYDFFTTGIYDKNRDFMQTASPSMDILVSSNLERLLYHIHPDSDETKKRMASLSEAGRYIFTRGAADFDAEFASQEECFQGIREMFETSGYVLDPHTAVAYQAYQKYRRRSGDGTKNVILATASPFKVTESVCAALDAQYIGWDAFDLMPVLAAFTRSGVPAQMKDLAGKEIRHSLTCGRDQMKSALENFLAKNS
ncbi:MAG: threonine synthase [Clostridiales bacterium]|nr:threonine synthase [Clostridiales bacterium]